jgi:hypothetical protein
MTKIRQGENAIFISQEHNQIEKWQIAAATN